MIYRITPPLLCLLPQVAQHSTERGIIDPRIACLAGQADPQAIMGFGQMMVGNGRKQMMPVAALLMVPWLLREGVEGIRGEACEDDDVGAPS